MIEYRKNRQGQWKPLKVIGLTFNDMETAIRVIRSTYPEHGINTIELRKVEPNGIIASEWDNL